MKLTATQNTENKFKLVLKSDNVVIDHTTITAAKLHSIFGVTIADSETDPTDWDFTNTGYLTVILGLTEAKRGTYKCKLIIKDATHTTGLAWDGTVITVAIEA